jgi:hypothetical protein
MGNARYLSIGVLGVLGIILADVLIHPKGTAAASKGVSTILTPSYSALLGGKTVQ